MSGTVIDNAHGINEMNIGHHLLEPKLEQYIDAVNEAEVKELYTVLEESHETDDGYTIYYDPTAQAFGLGLKTINGEKMALGIYGSFMTCLNGM